MQHIIKKSSFYAENININGLLTFLHIVHACRTLSNPEFGMVSLSGDNSIARYTCNQQYILVPPEFENRICLENDWSGAEPECGKFKQTISVYWL